MASRVFLSFPNSFSNFLLALPSTGFSASGDSVVSISAILLLASFCFTKSLKANSVNVSSSKKTSSFLSPTISNNLRPASSLSFIFSESGKASNSFRLVSAVAFSVAAASDIPTRDASITSILSFCFLTKEGSFPSTSFCKSLFSFKRFIASFFC